MSGWKGRIYVDNHHISLELLLRGKLFKANLERSIILVSLQTLLRWTFWMEVVQLFKIAVWSTSATWIFCMKSSTSIPFFSFHCDDKTVSPLKLSSIWDSPLFYCIFKSTFSACFELVISTEKLSETFWSAWLSLQSFSRDEDGQKENFLIEIVQVHWDKIS